MDSTEEKYGARLRLTLCFCSSEDDAYPCSNLRTQIRTSGGWQSGKHCEYPQELGFFFDGQVQLNALRLLVHESKISSCIDVLVANASDEEVEMGLGVSYEEATFTRLGHVRLSVNEENHFAARELKTIGIQRRCVYLKLLFNRPYTNSYNIFNQVGLVGITAHGTVHRTLTLWSNRRLQLPVSAVTEVALDEMVPFYHDPPPAVASSGAATEAEEEAFLNAATKERFKHLQKLKQKAIAEEDYDLAAALKVQIDSVKEAGKEIDELEKAKLKAVQEENYIEAKAIKLRIDALRCAGYHLAPAVSSVGSDHPEGKHRSPGRVPKSVVTLIPSEFDKTQAVGKGFYDLSDATGGIINSDRVITSSTVPVEGLGDPWEVEVNTEIAKLSGTQGNPETLSGDDAAEGKSYEADLGVYAVAAMLSRSGLQREAAIKGLFSDTSIRVLHQHSSSYINTILTYFGAKSRGVSDPVPGVVVATCACLRRILEGEIRGATVSQLNLFLDTVLQDCVSRLGDSNARVREAVEEIVIALTKTAFGVDKVASALIADPDKKTKTKTIKAPFQFHISRIHLLSTLVDTYGVDEPSPLTIEELFHHVLLSALQHAQSKVRDAAMKLVVKLFKLDGGRCTVFIKDIKPAQLSILEEELKQEDAGFPAFPIGPEMDNETVSVHHRGSRSTSMEPPGSKMGTPRLNTGGSRQSGGVSATRRPVSNDGIVSTRTCQFCREFNEDFTEDQLDIHYVRSCPMLCPCPLCDQVTEIFTLQQHLVTECVGHDLVRECPRCREAVRAEDLKQHVEAQACIEYTLTHSVCPLCHTRFKAGAEGWRKHLTTAPGCINNPRKYDGSGPIR